MIKRVKNKKIPKEKSLYFKNIQGCQEHHFILSLAAHASLKVLGIVSYEFYSDCRIHCHYVSIRVSMEFDTLVAATTSYVLNPD